MYASGRPALFAMRVLLIARLAHVESLFSRFNQRGLANRGATRARTIDRVEQEAYMALCAAFFTGLALADQRQRRGPLLESTDPNEPPTPPKTLDRDDDEDGHPLIGTPVPGRPTWRVIAGGRA